MFEIGLSCRFEGYKENSASPFSIKQLPLFEHREQKEYSGKYDQGSYCFLSRIAEPLCFTEKAGKKLWVFGTVFTNRKYADALGTHPKRVYAREILSILLEGPSELTSKIKGSFVLLLWDNTLKTLKIITDRHNVLPLFYCHKGKDLFISSSIPLLVKMADLDLTIDPVGMASQLVFDFPISDLHYLKGIRRFRAASTYIFSNDGMERESWWSVSSLFHDDLMSAEEALGKLSSLMFENVRLYSSDAPKLLLSLTGGFDGRTNLALLRKPKKDFLAYSYGMPGSLQIRVPQEVAGKTGIQYEPVYLEGEFLDNYSKYSHRSTVFSNGLAPIGFANIDYAFSRLSRFSSIAMTGLFGSEILRPLSPGLGIQMNNRVFDLFFDPNGPQKVKDYIKQFFNPSNFLKQVLTEGLEAVYEIFRKEFVERFEGFGNERTSFFFLLSEGMPKYFQQEIQIERAYVHTRFPYLDNDLIDLIYQTPFAGMYNGFLGNNKIKKRRGQLLYAHVMEKYYPQLNRIKVDRLYKPLDLIRVFPLNYLLLAAGVTRKNLYLRRKGGNDTFKTEAWTRSTIDQIVKDHQQSPHIDLSIKDSIIEPSQRTEATDITFRHLMSTFEFLKYLNNEKSKTQRSSFYQEKHPGQSLLHS